MRQNIGNMFMQVPLRKLTLLVSAQGMLIVLKIIKDISVCTSPVMRLTAC